MRILTSEEKGLFPNFEQSEKMILFQFDILIFVK
jgi:hypothetical protein